MQGVASSRLPPQNPPVLVGARRFSALATLVARVYVGYKLIQRRGGADQQSRYARHHRWCAQAAFDLATRLEGLPIKVCQFLGSRADVLPAEYVEVLSRLQDRVPPRPAPVMRAVVERELGAPIDDVFAAFD